MDKGGQARKSDLFSRTMKDTLKNHSLKITIGTAVIVALFLISATNYFVSRLERIEAKDVLMTASMLEIKEQGQRNKERIMSLEDKANQADLDRVKILTKLESIEVTLLEMKQDLKEHDQVP